MPVLLPNRAAKPRLDRRKASCGACHDPSKAFTNNSQANVGRGMHRVPSLVGLAYSAPYMADGCAKTLEERFSKVACGGGGCEKHCNNYSFHHCGLSKDVRPCGSAKGKVLSIMA